jgi:hypothetical protein
MPELFAPTLDDEIACVEREIVMRKRVYPDRVSRGLMQRAKAEREIETMKAVANRLNRIRDAEKRGGVLEMAEGKS